MDIRDKREGQWIRNTKGPHSLERLMLCYPEFRVLTVLHVWRVSYKFKMWPVTVKSSARHNLELCLLTKPSVSWTLLREGGLFVLCRLYNKPSTWVSRFLFFVAEVILWAILTVGGHQRTQNLPPSVPRDKGYQSIYTTLPWLSGNWSNSLY